MLYWPREIPARVVEWRPVTPGQRVGGTLDGRVQTAFLSGGAFWRLTLSGLVLRGRNAILAGNALQDALVGGRAIVVRPCDCRQVPLGPGQSLGDTPASDGAPFDDTLGDEDNPVEATISASALKAVTATITVAAGSRALRESDQFTPANLVWGPRMHRITRLEDLGGGVYSVRFYPGLREALAADTALDFNRPGCLMRAEGPVQIDQVIRNRLHQGQINFVELERPPLESEL